MALSQATLLAASKTLSDTDYDVAAGVSEALLSDFLQAHWATESASPTSVYKGKGRAEELGLGWSYDIRSAATIDLQPIAPPTFARIYKNWLRTVPETASLLAAPRATAGPHEKGMIGDTPPPNVQIQVRNLHVEIVPDQGEAVAFDYAMTVTGYVVTDVVSGQRILRIVPLSAKVTEPAKLNALVATRIPASKMVQSDDCVALQKLILYILNVLIANRIGSFVREFGLPVPIDVVKGVTIEDVEIQIVDDLLVVMGRLGRQPAIATKEAEAIDQADHEDLVRQALEVRQVGAKALTAGGEIIPVEPVGRSAALTAWPARSLFIILHERLFQAFAATVSVQTGAEHCKSILIVKACYGYSVRVWGATARVVANGLDLSARFAGSAWAKGCIKTHCGDACEKISIGAKAPPSTNAEFSIVGRDLWMSARPGSFSIDWEVGGVPWPISEIIEWVLEGLSSVALLIARMLGLQWKRQLTSFPDVFPGTTLRYEPKLDRRILKDPSQAALIILGDVDFLP